MSGEIERLANQQLESMQSLVAQNERGQYFISDLTMIDMPSSKWRVLNWVLDQLVALYPNRVWQESESIDPNVRGIMISWYPKRIR
jgi:hypothetical protein